MYGSLDTYQSQAVMTADPARLVLMLYDRVLVALTRAEQAQPLGDRETVHHELVRAQDILTELASALDHDAGDPIAAHLASLYDFCLDRLLRANVQQDVSLLDAVRSTIAGIRDSWDQACVQAAPLATVG